jgi:hypothetical protein
MKVCIVYTTTNTTASRKRSKYSRCYGLSVKLAAFEIRKAIREPIVWVIWEPRRLTILWTSMASYRDSFTLLTNIVEFINYSSIIPARLVKHMKH